LRRGIIDLSDTLILIFSVLLFVFIAIIAASIIMDTSVDAEIKSDMAYELITVTEKVMNSPCTTKGRGIFIDERLRSGNFRCLEMKDVYINVEERNCGFDNENLCENFFYVEEDEIKALDRVRYNERTRWENGTVKGKSFRSPVTVYNKDERNYQQAVLEVVIEE